MKSSKSCKYTGHMNVMNRVNNNKEVFESSKDKLHMNYEHGQPAKHEKKGSGVVYPESACTCKK